MTTEIHIVWMPNSDYRTTTMQEVYSTEKLAKQARNYLQWLNSFPERTFTVESRFVKEEF